MPTDMTVLTGATSFKLPANFSSAETPFSKLSSLQKPKFLYNVGDMLICVALSDIIKNHTDQTIFTFDKLIEEKDFSFDITAIEKSDMFLVDPASFFLQTRYDEVEWTSSKLRRGIQSLILHGGEIVTVMLENMKTFEKKMAELFLDGLPVPETDEEAVEVAEAETEDNTEEVVAADDDNQTAD